MTLRIQALLAAAGTFLIAGSASAIPTIKMIWRENLSASIGTPAVDIGSVIHAEIVLVGDDTPGAVNGVFISIEFDNADLTVNGVTELGTVKLPGMANTMSPLSLGTNVDNANGLVTGFDQATLDPVGCALGCDRTLGSVRFTVDAFNADSGGTIDDVVASLQNQGVDAVTTTAGGVTPIFESATVVPEPGSAAAGAVALATLLGLRRRRG